jgi:predicted house-cleaning NTP pyrophosphatase (Maf/HAM1 superfamily)
MRIIIAVVLPALCAGCVGPLVPVTRVDNSTASELQQTVRTYEARETPSNAAVLGPVTSTSCMNKLWDKPASNDDATNQLRLLSRQRGGNAVGNLVCESTQGTNLATNCWASVTCTGTAIKVADVAQKPVH